MSKEARDYKKLVAGMGANPLTGPIGIRVDVYRPRKSGDLDGRLKVLLDALQGVLYENDSQIIELSAGRHDCKSNPRAEVTVWQM